MKQPHVVIVGGGFGGLYAAKALSREPVKVTILDKTNHHTFQPLLYQVATAALNPADIAVPIRRALRGRENVTVLMANVTRVDVEHKRVLLEDGESIPYDYVIVAKGATHSYFGHDEFAAYAPGLKTMDDALMVRQRIFLAYEEAEREPDEHRRRALLTFVVVGGGPTGVEMAGALAEIARKTLPLEFRHIDPTKARIILIEGGDRVLGAYTPDLSEKAQKQLESLGVVVRTKSLATKIDDNGVMVGDELIPSKTVIWAAGVAASPLARSLGAPLDKVGRVMVTPELSIPGHDEVYVVGDLAHFEQDGHLLPGVAQVAMQGSQCAAKNIARSIDDRPRLPFRYHDKGSMATIGKAAAVADLGFAKLSGFFAWLAWALIHVLFLIGFKNRLIVMVQWVWAYFAYDRGSRLIHGRVHERATEPAMLPSLRAAQLAPARRALMDVETVEAEPAEPQTTETERPEGEAASR
ncbi:MAG: NAD(P)/FAD-dependent oxidoreductase [Polyangiaceae bacterium]|nr:NAD(P)/FAD-dependent oxidoreductase [Polyangiaceae bacterium]